MSRFDVIDQDILNQLNEVAADVGTKSFQFLKTFASRPASPLEWKVSNPGLNLAKHNTTAAEPNPPTDEPQPPVRANDGHGPLDDEIPFSPCVA